MVSHCSIPPLGCNGVNCRNSGKLEQVSFVPRLLKRNYFEGRSVMNKKTPHFLLSRRKPLGPTRTRAQRWEALLLLTYAIVLQVLIVLNVTLMPKQAGLKGSLNARGKAFKPQQDATHPAASLLHLG